MATYGRRAAKRKPIATDALPPYTPDAKRGKFESSTNGLGLATELPSFATPPSTGKLTKRMLGRSRTETSLTNVSASAGKSTLVRTPSLPVATTATINSSSDTLPTIPEPTTPPRPKTKVSRTYAGASRSFLAAISATGLPDEHAQQQEENDEYSRESYSSLRHKYGIDQSSDDDQKMKPPALTPTQSFSSTMGSDASPSPPSKKGKAKAAPVPEPLAPGMMNPLKSISELRSRGENRRFMDDVGYLFEGMNREGPIALRRASALEIITNLCDAEFNRKARAADFIGHSWELFSSAGCGTGEDKILDLLLVLLAALVARDTTLLDEIMQRFPDGAPALLNLWKNTAPEKDPLIVLSTSASNAALRQMGFGKKDQGVLSNVHSLARRHITTDTDLPISTSFLLASVLSSVSPALLPSAQIGDLLDILKQQLQTAGHMSSQGLTPPYETIHPALKLLNSYMLGQWRDSEETSISGNVMENELEFANGIIDLAITAERAQAVSDHNHASKCLDFLLRILLSVSHSDDKWCRKLMGLDNTLPFILREMSRADHQRASVTPITAGKAKDDPDATEVSEQDEESANGTSERALDRLCLSLGILTNLVLVLEDFGDSLLSTSVSQICALLPKPCITSSACSHKLSTSVEILLQVYSRQKPPKHALDLPTATSPNPDVYFLMGHLSILFGMLLRSCPSKRDLILDGLPLDGNKREKVEQLVDQAEILSAFYEEFGGLEDRHVTKEVITFLEKLSTSL